MRPDINWGKAIADFKKSKAADSDENSAGPRDRTAADRQRRRRQKLRGERDGRDSQAVTGQRAARDSVTEEPSFRLIAAE
jgi:hypothetical protein